MLKTNEIGFDKDDWQAGYLVLPFSGFGLGVFKRPHSLS